MNRVDLQFYYYFIHYVYICACMYVYMYMTLNMIHSVFVTIILHFLVALVHYSSWQVMTMAVDEVSTCTTFLSFCLLTQYFTY